ncbi:hypothetical protein [Amycolatopsis eburnea]|uniref:Uncharacterized protein n=1 Tax=Amycolatopsis eburnea TaxID=2267691 RepID=A0A427SYX7_9PSEU|nr:hypothetical protein [Amycolatopsis eburnea]RSD10275.1 hypothetical protein EIY87_35910 [Amycolatopsis eburnea]
MCRPVGGILCAAFATYVVRGTSGRDRAGAEPFDLPVVPGAPPLLAVTRARHSRDLIRSTEIYARVVLRGVSTAHVTATGTTSDVVGAVNFVVGERDLALLRRVVPETMAFAGFDRDRVGG